MADETGLNGVMERLLRALLDAYPTRAALEQMLFYGLNVRLNEIAAESLNLRDTADKVIKWFHRRNHLRDLIEAARERSPESPALKALVESLPPPSTGVRVRRTVHHYPRHVYALLLCAALGLGLLTVTVMKADLTEGQLTFVKGALGVAAAVFMGVVPKRLRLRVGDAVVYGGALATLLLTFATPASAGLKVVSGHVFYKDTLEPVPNVVVVIRDTNQKSGATAADGHFTIDSVPITAKDLYVQWGGGPNIPAVIERSTGGAYAVVPKPPTYVPTRATAIASSAWKRAKRETCPTPRAAFVLDATIPAHTVAAPTYVEITLRNGTRFVSAFTRNKAGAGVTLAVDRSIQRRWEFPASASPVQSDIEVCLEPPKDAIPAVDDMAVTYWYVEKK